MKTIFNKATALLLTVLSIISIFPLAGISASAATIGSEYSNEVNLDDFGDVISNEELEEPISYSGYITKAEYEEYLLNRNTSAVSASGYYPTFEYCYNSNGKEITVQRTILGHAKGNNALMIKINGNHVYCIKPGEPLKTYTNLNNTSKVYNSLSWDKRNALNTVMCYSFDGEKSYSVQRWGSITEAEAYLATQLIVWEFTEGQRNITSPYALKDGCSGYLSMFSPNASTNPNIRAYYNKLSTAIAGFQTIPSFMGKQRNKIPTVTLSANYYEASDTWTYESATLNDANGVLSTNFGSLTGTYNVGNAKVKVTQSGNKISLSIVDGSVSATKDSAPYQFYKEKTKIPTQCQSGFLIAYEADAYQPVICGGSIDPPQAYLNIQVDVTSHGITRDGVIQKVVFTQSEYEDDSIADGEGSLSTAENLDGWYYYVTVPNDFKTYYGTDHIVLGPTDELGMTQSIADYIADNLDENISHNVPAGMYDYYELGRLKDGASGNNFSSDYEFPDGWRQADDNTYATDYPNGSPTGTIRIAALSGQNFVTSYAYNIFDFDLEVKKVCEDGGTKRGYYFMLTSETGAKQIIGPTGSDGKITVTLADGKYTVKELGLKDENSYYIPDQYDGYEVAPELNVEISAEAYKSAVEAGYDAIPLTFTNTCSGYISIIKADADTSKKLAGAVYGIYSDKTAKNLMESLTTDSNGTATTKSRYAIGTYYLQEITAPAGYELDETIYAIEITAKHLSTVSNTIYKNVTDEKIKKPLEVKKSSEDGYVEGFYFNIKGSDGVDYGNIVTSASGIATINDLPVYDDNNNFITYTVTELGLKQSNGTYVIPTRYIAPGSKSTTLNPDIDKTSVSFTNTLKKGNITVKKSSDDGIIANIYFNVKGSNGIDYGTKSTNTSGSATFKNLPIYGADNNRIKYTITELGEKQADGTYKVPQRYTTPATHTVTLTQNGATVTVSHTNTTKTGGLKIVKTSDDGVKQNIWFKVMQGSTLLGNYRTNSNGEITITGLPVYGSDNSLIKYTITELGEKQSDGTYKISNRYYTPSAQNVNLVYNKTTTVTVSNKLKPGIVTVTKTAEDNFIEGIKFSLQGMDFGGNWISVTAVTNKNGVATFNNVPKGTYTVSEVTSNIRYIATASQNVTVVPAENSQLSFENNLKKGSLTISKRSDDGVVANIYFNVKGSNGVDYGTKSTNTSGIAKFSNLPIYGADNSLIKYTVTELGEKQSDGTYIIPYRYTAPTSQAVTLDGNSDLNITFKNTLKVGSVELIKTNSDGNTLSGVSYNLYNADGTLLSVYKKSANGDYSFTKTGSYTTSCNTLITNSKGRIFIDNLPQGDYYFTEIKTVSGNNLLAKNIEFSVKGDTSETLAPKIKVKDSAITVLPNTGGSNAAPLMIGLGFLLISASAAYIFIRKKKSNKKGGTKMNRKRISKSILSIVIMMTMLLSMLCVGLTANAATMKYHINYNKTASLTLYKYEMPDISLATNAGTGETSDADKIPESATPLADVEFTAYLVDGLDNYFLPDGIKLPTVTEAENLIKPTTKTYSAVTDETGYAAMNSLPLGIYLIKETDGPAQVTKPIAPFVVSLPTTDVDGEEWLYDVTCYPKNETAYGNVTLHKVDSSVTVTDEETLANAEFTLYKKDKHDNEWQTYMTGIKTGADGNAFIENLPCQTDYKFVETKAPDESYILDSTVSYDFYIDGTGDAIVNGEAIEDNIIVAGNETVEIEKYILDGEKGTEGIDNTASFGDTVYWKIKTSVPAIVKKLETYTIVDTMSTGLEYKDSEVWIDNATQLTENTDYTVTEDGLTVTFKFDPTKLDGAKEVEIYFNTILTEDAPLAQDIPNTSRLIYTNDIGTESTYSKASQTPTVHTGGYAFVKTDGSSPLGGAEFKIYASEEDATNGENALLTATSSKEGLVRFDGLAYGEFSVDENGKAENGVNGGSRTYWIVETNAPDGYILQKAPISVVINNKSHVAENNEENINNLLPVLPQTGGTGSTILFAVAILLILSGALIFIKARKKQTKY